MTTDSLFVSSSKVIRAILACGSDERPLDDRAAAEFPFVGPEAKPVNRSAWLEPCGSRAKGWRD